MGKDLIYEGMDLSSIDDEVTRLQLQRVDQSMRAVTRMIRQMIADPDLAFDPDDFGSGVVKRERQEPYADPGPMYLRKDDKKTTHQGDVVIDGDVTLRSNLDVTGTAVFRSTVNITTGNTLIAGTQQHTSTSIIYTGSSGVVSYTGSSFIVQLTNGSSELRVAGTLKANTISPYSGTTTEITGKLIYNPTWTTVTSSTYTALSTDTHVELDASSNDITVTLMSANAGHRISFVRTDATANTVTVKGNNENINGDIAGFTLDLQYDYGVVIPASNATEWYIGS